MKTSVLVAGARTPIGKMSGALANFTAPELGGFAIKAALERAGILAHEVDSIFFGNVVQAGVGGNPARQAAVLGGLPMNVPATSINKLCLSGLTAIGLADQAIKTGYITTALTGGTESMTNAPYLARGARRGFKYGPTQLEDALDRDALICSIDNEVMGYATQRYQTQYNISREDQDAFAVESHRRAAAATTSGVLGAEIVPVTVTSRSEETLVSTDEGIRAGTTLESLGKLRPAFASDGSITAGSASQLSDGACALIVMDKDEAERRGLAWLAEIVSYGTVAGPDASLLLQPAGAIQNALDRSGSLKISNFDVIEINEAFASVALASSRKLRLNLDRVNPNGGAIALGHPVGMSGARVVLTLALELQRRGGGTGVAALCGGGGQGDALIIRVP